MEIMRFIYQDVPSCLQLKTVYTLEISLLAHLLCVKQKRFIQNQMVVITVAKIATPVKDMLFQLIKSGIPRFFYSHL